MIAAIFAGHFHFSFIGKVTKATGPDNGLTYRKSFIRGKLLRPLGLDRAVNVNSAARFFTHPIDGQDHSGVIIIFFLEGAFDSVGEFSAGFSFGRDQTDIRHFQFTAIVDAQSLRVIVSIFHHAKTDVIVAAEFLFVVEHLHRVGAHDRVRGGRRRRLYWCCRLDNRGNRAGRVLRASWQGNPNDCRKGQYINTHSHQLASLIPSRSCKYRRARRGSGRNRAAARRNL